MDHKTSHGYIAATASGDVKAKVEYWQSQADRLGVLAEKLRALSGAEAEGGDR